MNAAKPEHVYWWVAGRVPRDVEAAIHATASAEDVVHVAVMPDVHLSNEVCVGTVVATNRLIYPAAIGGDIGCGMLAAPFDCGGDVLRDESDATKLLRELSRAVPAVRHHVAPEIPRELAAQALSDPALENVRRRDGAIEFATLGRGNHFLEFQTDEENMLWIMIHSGSRAMGPAIRDFHLRRAHDGNEKLLALDSLSQEGRAFLHDLGFARRYAAASRFAMLHAASAIMKRMFNTTADLRRIANCDHNHVSLETHFGRSLWVHRKGASSARDGEPGLIPSSMGAASFHTLGRGNALSLCSSSHGAGRAMSRAEARKRVSISAFRQQMRGIWFDQRMIEHLRDEAPAAYKDSRVVMRAQHNLTRIVRKLRPLLCYKGG